MIPEWNVITPTHSHVCSRPPRYYSDPYICRPLYSGMPNYRLFFFCRRPKPSWYQSLLRACVHAFSSLHPLISAGIYHSESHRSLDGGNESLLSNICRVAAAKEVNLLLRNLLPVISPRALIKHQASTPADLLSKAIWWRSMRPLNYWELEKSNCCRSSLCPQRRHKKVPDYKPDI